MTDQSAGQPASSPQQVRSLALVLAVSPVVVYVAVGFALADANTRIGVGTAALIVLLVVIGFLAAQTLGFRAQPLPSTAAGPAATTEALRTYSTLMILRFVMTEAPMILTLALAFALDDGIGPLVIGLAAGLPALLIQVWPSARNVRRVADRLESDGGRSGLRETFGV